MTAVKYPKDREKLDDFYKDWYEVNKDDLADTWQRPEVYDFASKYASHVLQEYKKGLLKVTAKECYRDLLRNSAYSPFPFSVKAEQAHLPAEAFNETLE